MSSVAPMETDLVVVGAGPGGYAAAFYAADLGKKVILVEQEKRLGGVCLNAGCIPSKALLHATELVRESRDSAKRGIRFREPEIDLGALRAWKEGILEKLGAGIRMLAQRRGVEVMQGRGYFEDSQTLRVETKQGQKFIRFGAAILAVGSKPALPAAFDLGNPRVMTSTEALALEEIPRDLLVVGGGYIGLELGTVYATLGSNVVLVEATGALLSGMDPDLVRPVQQYAQAVFKEVRLNVKVSKLSTAAKQIKVAMETAGQKREELYDRVLVSIGRAPNCENLGLENTKVLKDAKGFVQVDEKQQTADPLIYAIGDIVGGAMLAHKASKEARVAVEALTGENASSKEALIPAVVFTDPEVAWVGLTEAAAAAQKIPVEVARFPWAASGRALTLDRQDGLTKLILEPGTERLLGVGIVGHGAGELISEGALAVEMGATARDLAETVHPHPTLSETLMECAESFYGTSTHLFLRRRNTVPG